MDNCKSVISKHNFGTLLKNISDVVASTKDNCNCIESTECPLNNNCLTKSVVYKAEVTDDTGIGVRDGGGQGGGGGGGRGGGGGGGGAGGGSSPPKKITKSKSRQIFFCPTIFFLPVRPWTQE